MLKIPLDSHGFILDSVGIIKCLDCDMWYFFDPILKLMAQNDHIGLAYFASYLLL